MSDLPKWLRDPHDEADPSPWLALYLDQSVAMAEPAKRAWLEDVSSKNRQYVLPITRPFARLMIALIQLLKILMPRFQANALLHRMLRWFMKTFLTPNANLLIMRHFHIGSEILRFIADNSGVAMKTHPLRPRSLDDIPEGRGMFLQHDVNLFNFVIELNQQLRAQGRELTQPVQLDFSAISSEPPTFEPFPRRWTNFIDLESAIELYTPMYQLLLTDHDFWRATNSLQLDETIALYVGRILGSSTHVALVNNKHPLVPMTTLRAGYRLVLHGLSTELLHEMLVKKKREHERALRAAE